MNEEEYKAAKSAMMQSIKRYPNCKIANCDCDSFHDHWTPDCKCLCHLMSMDRIWGNHDWTFEDFENQVSKGYDPDKE